MRIVKDFDDRRKEFLQLTKELFFSVGYEKMTIQMLTGRAGVAKGTFYHYFKSKEDLLSQWVMNESEQVMAVIEKIVNDEKLDAVQKLNAIFEKGGAWKAGQLDLFVPLIKAMYNDVNIRLRAEMTKQLTQLAAGMYGKVITEGVEQGMFSTPYPEEIAGVVIRMSQLFSEDLSRMILDHYDGKDVSFDDAKKHLCIWQDTFERLIGAQKDSLRLAENDLIAVFFDYKSH